MSTFAERMLQTEPWSGLIMGNYALARAMIESGVKVATTYPGSPTPEIAAALSSPPKELRPYYFEYSLNEKVALEVAAGASMNGHLSTVFFKSVGLNVASDSLIQLSMMELIGGMVVVLGDDPGANSSQNEQDNRHFSRMSYIPMFEPATPQEAYEMYKEAATLAQKHRAPVLFRMTTHVCHAREVVQFGESPEAEYDWSPRFDNDNGPYWPITEAVFPLKRKALDKLEAIAAWGEETSLNTVLKPNGIAPAGGKRRGLISSAIPAYALLENLDESGHPIDMLKVGMTYPLPLRKIAQFLRAHDEVLVVEELDPILETEIKALAYDEQIDCRILARTEREEMMRELGPDRTWALLSRHWPALFEEKAAHVYEDKVAPRLPQMCPGCGHRSAFHAVKQALSDDDITVADIGCHSLGALPPYDMGKILLSMGHSMATGAGLSIGNQKRKILSFIGDSTFFHAGIPALVNAVVNEHNITLVLLENGTTAMTGHQPRPGTGEVGEKIPLIDLLKNLGVGFIRDVDAYQQPQLIGHVREALDHDGFSVVIARHPCMLKFTRDQRRKMPGFKLPAVKIDQDKCDRALVCLKDFGCPTFITNEDGSVGINEDLCIGDGSCLQTCPVNAIERQPMGGAK